MHLLLRWLMRSSMPHSFTSHWLHSSLLATVRPSPCASHVINQLRHASNTYASNTTIQRGMAITAIADDPAKVAAEPSTPRRRTTRTTPTPVDQDPAAYWSSVLSRVDHPEAKRLLQYLDLTHPLGLTAEFQKERMTSSSSSSSSRNGRRSTRSSTTSKSRETLYDFFLNVKNQHPTKVLLVRVGEFYETMGTDAVMLVQWAALRPMGSGKPPKAGCRVGNIRRTLRDLLDQGLSVVVCEEAPEDLTARLRSKTLRQTGKQRYIAGVVTPAQPNYVVGLMDDEQDDGYQHMPPVLGVTMGVSGFKLMEVDITMGTCMITEHITEDALVSRLQDGSMVLPLYIHSSVAQGPTRQARAHSYQGEWETRLRQLARFRQPLGEASGGLVRRFEGVDAVEGLLRAVKQDNCLQDDVEFSVVSSNSAGRPAPLFHSTASNLGLHATQGVPQLLNALLPADAQDPLRGWMRKLLLAPPPPAVGASIQRACGMLAEMHAPLPDFPLVQPGRLVLRLQYQEADDAFFRELHDLAAAVHDVLTRNDVLPLAEALLPAVSLEMKMPVDVGALREACAATMSAIEDVVELEPSLLLLPGTGDVDEDDTPNTLSDGEDEDGEEEGEEEDAEEAAQAALLEASGGDTGVLMQQLLPKLMRLHEGFRNKVLASRVGDLYQQVDDARLLVLQEASAALTIAHNLLPYGRNKPYLAVDHANKTLWVRQGSVNAKAAEVKGLMRPRDRNHKVVNKFFSTPALEDAQLDYRALCLEAQKEVRRELKQLAVTLTAHLQELVAAASFSIVCNALQKHVAVAIQSGWSMPVQLPFIVDNMWPYWLPAGVSTTTSNSFSMQGLFILTGPNMAGKSTLLRSTCALAVLSACGLYVPARAATVPYFDSFVLRNFSADSPMEGKSSFAMEMSEMRSLLDSASPYTLALVDELGKGTEVKAGTAIAGAMLESLAHAGCRGVFATHLHALRQLPLKLPGVEWMQMETQEERDHDTGVTVVRPTNRIIPGYSSASLALQVALTQGVPPGVVSRADLLLQDMDTANVLSPQPIHTNDTPTLEQARAAQTVAVNSQSMVNGQRNGELSGNKPAGPTIADVWAAHVLYTISQSVGNFIQHDTQHNTQHDTHPRDTPVGGEDGQGMWEGEGHGGEQYAVHVLGKKQLPPPSVTGYSYVYVVRRPTDNAFYCGQTDDLLARLKRHRLLSSAFKGSRNMEACYTRVSNTSVATAVEARTITALQQAGFTLVSATDARSTKLPRSTARATA